jgi:hypothetical protein
MYLFKKEVVMRPRSGWVMTACILTVLLATGANGGDTPAALPTVDQVLDRYVASVGGREALESLETRVCRLHLTDDLSGKDPPVEVVPIESAADAAGRVRWTEHKTGDDRSEGFDGRIFWVDEGAGPVTRDDPIPLKLRYLYDPQGPLRFREYFPGLTVDGVQDVAGHSCYRLVPADLDPAYYASYFDVATGDLVRLGHYWSLEDYREIDGVRVPFRVVNSRKGGSSTYVFDSIEHNATLSANLFAPPDPH